MTWNTVRSRSPGGTPSHQIHGSVLQPPQGYGPQDYGYSAIPRESVYGYAPHPACTAAGPEFVYAHCGDGAPSPLVREEAPPTPAASSAAYACSPPSSVYSSSDTMKRRDKCSRNTPICLTLGILCAMSFLTGYVLLIGSLVNVSRRHKDSGNRVTPARLRSAAVVIGPPALLNEEDRKSVV